MASTAEDQARSHGLCKSSCLIRDFFLVFSRKVDKSVEFGTNQKRYGGLVESAPLSVPLLDRVECAFSCKVEHEENGDSIIADEWQHVNEFALTTKIPYGECNLGIPYRDGLLHKVNT